MSVSGPFMTLKQAAQYCGYHPDTLSRKLRDFDVPRHGPEKNRFAKSVLDSFMENPELYRHQKKAQGRKPKLVTV